MNSKMLLLALISALVSFAAASYAAQCPTSGVINQDCEFTYGYPNKYYFNNLYINASVTIDLGVYVAANTINVTTNGDLTDCGELCIGETCFPPIINLDSPQNTTYNSPNINLNYTATDSDLDSCWYELDSTVYNLVNCQNASIYVHSGHHVLTLYANDSAGNENSTTVGFTANYKLYYDNGNWTSEVKRINGVLWYIYVDSTVPENTSLKTYYRVGNVSVPDATWTDWTEFTSGQKLGVPTKYVQLFLELSTSDETVSPKVSRVRIVYG